MKNKVIVITGASSGIGAEMAVLLSQHGAVPVLLARSLPKLMEVSSRIQGDHAVYELDVTSTKQVFETIQKILERYGKIDVLINNAGFAIFETFEDAALEHLEEMMNVNYMGLVRCTKAVLPSMLKNGYGHIINIASIAGKIGISKSTGYAASKHAVLGFTNSLRQELTDKGIYVSAINPGPVRTSFFELADPSGDYLNNLPPWFILQPQQVAKSVVEVINQKRAEKNIPRLAGFGANMIQILPRSFDRIINKLTNKK